MKLLKACLVSLVMVLAFKAHSKTTHTISFNLHCTFEDWRMRLDEVARQLAQSRPDVISFQEVCRDSENDMAKGILEALKRHGYPVAASQVQFSHIGWDRYDEFLMIISRHPVQEEEKGFLPWSPLQRSFLSFKIDGTWYINTHLEHADEYAGHRSEQIRFLVDKYQGKAHMIMGDYNSETHSPEQVILTERNYRSFFPGPTRPADFPTKGIDGFWVSPELEGKFAGARSRLLFTERHRGIFLSDHLGVEFKATVR